MFLTNIWPLKLSDIHVVHFYVVVFYTPAMAKMHILFYKLSINYLLIHFKTFLFYFKCILYLQ